MTTSNRGGAQSGRLRKRQANDPEPGVALRFFNGQFIKHELLVDPKGGYADINLVYRSGPRFVLGKVSFGGDTPFDEVLLQRMVPFKPDTPYDSQLVNELNQNLQSSGYFEVVRVDAAPSTAVGQVIPVDVELHTRKPRTMTLGLGYSTDTGPRGKASWMRHWDNARGDSYGFESEISQPKQNVGAWYDIPLDPPLTDKLRFAAGYQYEEIANTDTLSKLLTVGPEWHSKLDNGWTRIVSLKWQHEEYRLGDDSGLSTLLMPGVSYSVLRSDNRIDPTHGYSVSLDAQVAKEGLMSDTNLLHGNAQFKALTTLWDKHRFLGRVQFGGSATNGYKSIPPSLRFLPVATKACAAMTIRACRRRTLMATVSVAATWWRAASSINISSPKNGAGRPLSTKATRSTASTSPV